MAMLIGLTKVPASVPVFAQSMMPGFRLGEGKEYSEEEKAKLKAQDQDERRQYIEQYRAKLGCV